MAETALLFTSGIDLTGANVVLDDDGDTLIKASTDDQIDFRAGGSDVFRMTASSFDVLVAGQEWHLIANGNNLELQSQDAAQAAVFEIANLDNDGTDDVLFAVDAVGNSGVADFEILEMGYDADNTRYEIRSLQQGSGAVREIRAYTGANTDQLVLTTAGNVTMGGNLTVTGTIDMAGSELLLDADGDTSITADTDDQIDFAAAGSDVLTLSATSGTLSIPLICAHGESSGVSLTLRNTGSSGASGGATLFLETADGSANVSGDELGEIIFAGHGVSAGLPGAEIRAFAEETWSVSQRGTSLRFYTISSGSTTMTERLQIDSAGDLIATAVTKIRDGNVSLIVGADNVAQTLTDATNKAGRIGVPHYTNAEEPMACFLGSPSSGANALSIGGGSSLLNAATVIDFYAANNTTTTAGTKVASLNTTQLSVDQIGDLSGGDLVLAPTGVVQFGTHTAIGAESLSGYITIKDAGGTSRKIAVVS